MTSCLVLAAKSYGMAHYLDFLSRFRGLERSLLVE
ncbi:hypothetical protein EVA_03867 [gut metagenome]|uniref:Uncharacterized protein n=1 Tax=gut metagenome TaxID=749906 RepID=J9GJW6_9ZZZZ